MLIVSDNAIQLTRGDTMILELSLVDENGDEYIPVDTDTIIFRLKRNASATTVLVEKDIPYDTMILQLDPDDTQGLKFGVYYYEIEIITEAGYHFTAIANTEFEITEELETHG